MSSPNTRRRDENDILIRLTIANRGPERSTIHLLPTLWFRNTWSWGPVPEECATKPSITLERDGVVRARHEVLGEYQLRLRRRSDGRCSPKTKRIRSRLYGYANGQAFVKDALSRISSFTIGSTQ